MARHLYLTPAPMSDGRLLNVVGALSALGLSLLDRAIGPISGCMGRPDARHNHWDERRGKRRQEGESGRPQRPHMNP